MHERESLIVTETLSLPLSIFPFFKHWFNNSWKRKWPNSCSQNRSSKQHFDTQYGIPPWAQTLQTKNSVVVSLHAFSCHDFCEKRRENPEVGTSSVPCFMHLHTISPGMSICQCSGQAKRDDKKEWIHVCLLNYRECARAYTFV